MEPFITLAALTPPAGRLKCVWVRGADGHLESIWVPDWEQELAQAEAAAEATATRPESLRRAG